MFDLLREKYDYIIVDAPAAELVSDAFILGQYGDIALFIIRQNVTLKKQLDFIKDIDHNKKFKKITLVLNDIKNGRKTGYFYYQYRLFGSLLNKNN